MRASLIKSHGATPQLWWFSGLMVELMHSVIIQMNESMSIFYQKWLDIETKQKIFRYLTIDLTSNQRDMLGMDFAKLYHLTDPE